MISLILANLTPAEMEAFHAARVTYSGSTGAGATQQTHGGCAPYIATDYSVFHNAVHALGWQHFSVEVQSNGQQWIVRRAKHTDTNYVANHEVYPTHVEFSNGRTVGIAYEEGRVFLTVGRKEQL